MTRSGRHAATARMERAAATTRVRISPLTLGAKESRPSFECVSLAQREFGLPGRDCRTMLATIALLCASSTS
jgi:hypothetical protein